MGAEVDDSCLSTLVAKNKWICTSAAPPSVSSWCGQGQIFLYISILRGHAVAQLVEALRYKPEGRGFDSG